MKILAFGASNSKSSINQQLALYSAKKIKEGEVTLLDLNDFEMPIYSEDREKEHGIHYLAKIFYNYITNSDVIVISFAEYNGTYTAAFKNILDWVSRIDMKIYQGKPLLILATSPGDNGAKTVLNAAKEAAPFLGANIIGAISLPDFYENFDAVKKTVTLESFNNSLNNAYSLI